MKALEIYHIKYATIQPDSPLGITFSSFNFHLSIFNFKERSTWNTPYKFSGKELDDETGYSYFGARYYDPNISIWLSVDPLADQFPGYSPYVYVYNNPIVMEDIGGYFPTHAEARHFKRRNGITGRIAKTEEGIFFLTRSADNAQFAFNSMGIGYKEKQRNWGGINWFTKSGVGGEQETRKSFSDVLSVNIDRLLQMLGISGGAKTTSKGAGNLGEEIINAAKDINNVKNAFEGLKTLGNESGLLPASIRKEKDPDEIITIPYQNKNSEWHSVKAAKRKDSTSKAAELSNQGHRVYNLDSPKNAE